jgi:hypothetical protein
MMELDTRPVLIICRTGEVRGAVTSKPLEIVATPIRL